MIKHNLFSSRIFLFLQYKLSHQFFSFSAVARSKLPINANVLLISTMLILILTSGAGVRSIITSSWSGARGSGLGKDGTQWMETNYQY